MTKPFPSEEFAARVDAHARLAELRQDRIRLAYAARYDGDVRAELDDIDSQIRACERELDR